jgi:hypothetical protein
VHGSESVEITTPKLDVTGEYERQKYESQSHGVTVSITLPQFAAAAAIANTALGTVLDKVVPNQAAAGSSGGGKAGIGISYLQSNSHNNSGQYVMSNISSPKLTINAPSQHIDGAVINDKVINPSNNQDYADSGSSSFGFGVGTSGVNASVGFGDHSFGLGTGSGGMFGSVGVGDFNIGASLNPGTNRVGLFGGAYGVGGSFGFSGSSGLFDAGVSYGPIGIGGTFGNGRTNINASLGLWNVELIDYASKGTPISSELKEQRLEAIDQLSEQITDSGLQAQEIKPLVEQLQEARNIEMLYGTDNAAEVSNLRTSLVVYEMNEIVASSSSQIDTQILREIVETYGNLNTSTGPLGATSRMFDPGPGGGGFPGGISAGNDFFPSGLGGYGYKGGGQYTSVSSGSSKSSNISGGGYSGNISPSSKGTLKNIGLPTTGKIRFVPSKDWNPGQQLKRGPNNGYYDKFGNEWTKGPSRTPGESFEWDVQLGRNASPWMKDLSRSGRHVNVSPKGRITH